MTKKQTTTIAFVTTTLLVVPLLFVGTNTAFARDIFSGTSGGTENSDSGDSIPAKATLLQSPTPTQTSVSPQAPSNTILKGIPNPAPISRQRELRNSYTKENGRDSSLRKDAKTRRNDFLERSRRLRSEMELKAKEGIQRLRKNNTHVQDSLNASINGDQTESKRRENFLRFKRGGVNEKGAITSEIRREKGTKQTQVKEIRRERSIFGREIQSRREKIQEALNSAKTPQEKNDVLKRAREEGALLLTRALKRRAEFRTRAKTLREEFKTQREALRAKIKTKAAERIKGRLEDILGRISDALTNFTDILARVHNGIAELNANGVDTTDATTAAATAEKAIGDASVALSNARTTFNSILESSNPKDQIKEVRTSVKEAIVTVKAAHTKLGEAIQILKDMLRTNNNTPSSTTAGTTTNTQPIPTTQSPATTATTTK